MPHPSCAAGYLESHVPTASQTGAPRPHKVDVEQLQVIMPLSSPLHPLLSPLLSSPLSPLLAPLLLPLSYHPSSHLLLSLSTRAR